MMTDGKKWHYLDVKKLSALLKILTSCLTSSHKGDFYCLNCFYSYSTEIKFKRHENVCKNHDYCYMGMPNEDEVQPWRKIYKSSIYYLC